MTGESVGAVCDSPISGGTPQGLTEVAGMLGRDAADALKTDNVRLLREVARLRGRLDALLGRGFLPDVSRPELLPLEARCCNARQATARCCTSGCNSMWAHNWPGTAAGRSGRAAHGMWRRFTSIGCSCNWKRYSAASLIARLRCIWCWWKRMPDCRA